MVELPDDTVPNGAEPFPIDFGYWLAPTSGAEELRVDRKGGRFGATFTLPPMRADKAKVVVSRLLAAFYGETLLVEYPLLDEPQGAPGSPVVDGAGQSGTTLEIRGLTPGYAIKEGFWLTIVDENGRGYLHNNRTPIMVGADGTATITVAPMLRWPFLDGATIRLAAPTMEGKVPAQPWQLPVDKLVRVGFEIREVA